jgi:hypothetical protein
MQGETMFKDRKWTAPAERKYKIKIILTEEIQSKFAIQNTQLLFKVQ